MITLTPPSTSFGGPPTDRPLVLFPVRLETRFVTESGTSQLLVRVYVEDLAVDWHEPGLTDSEFEWGRAFWERVWRSGPSDAQRRAAWGQLGERFGAPRAAYIADVLQPTNVGARPTTAGAAGAPSPAFPDRPKPRAPTGPRTRVMPDRWLAIGWVNGPQAFTFAGRPIARDPLRVGPSPDASAGFDASTLKDDPELGWLVDFDAAEAIGMGLRIPYTLSGNARIERLLVFGARGSLDPGEGSERVSELMRAHRFTDGLAFISQATPTNNTADAPSSFNSLDPGYETSPTADSPSYTAGDGSNRDILARVLGIDAAVFAQVPGAAVPEQRDAYHMNTLLWKAGWGYALEHLLEGPGSPSADSIRLGREHFSSFVRARGPLPALRVGRQPYGLLPAISLDRWQPREGVAIDDPLRRFLVAARNVWREGLRHVPRVPLSSDPAADLLRVLAMAPGTVGFTTRRAARLAQVATGPPPPPNTTGDTGALGLARSLGVSWTPHAIRTMLAADPAPGRISGGLVQPLEADAAIETLSDSAPPTPNYLRSILASGHGAVRGSATAPPATNALLHLLARHAALHEYLGAAFRILARRNAVTPTARREPDLTDGGGSPWALLDTRLADRNNEAIGSILDTLKAPLRDESGRDVASTGAIWRRNLYQVAPGKGGTPDLAPDVTEFAAFVRALNYLADRPSAVLARAFAETIDLCSHRFDAWATSFATKRLEWLRGRKASGLYLGAYGFVEDLAPTPRQTATPPRVDPVETPPPPELAAPLSTSAGSQGYVHAPSLAHGTTAAILRSGYLSRRATDDGEALAINLSSARVRTAMWLLDGVRQGQSLASLLGYRFERALHENRPDLALDRYIPAFRRIALASVAAPTGNELTWATAVNALPASSVVDGLALLKKHREPDSSAQRIPWGSGGLLPSKASEPYNVCRRALDTLEDALDAVADLVLAESVHHVAQGNPVRAGATLEAVAHGEAPPPQIDVARTPRTGIGITHRLAVLMDAARPGAAWGPSTPRALAEPYLNGWAALLLGPDAAGARCRAEFLDPLTGEVLVDGQGRPLAVEPALVELGLAPIDLISLPEQDGTARQSELEQRVIQLAFRSRPAGAGEHAHVRLLFDRQPGWPARTLSFADVLEATRAVTRLVHGARALTPRDVSLPEAEVPASADAEPAAVPVALRLSSRAQAAAAGLRATHRQLQALIDPGAPEPKAETLRGGLLGLSAYGIAGATPVSPAGDTASIRADLKNQAVSVASEASRRIERLGAVEAAWNRRVAALASATPAGQPTATEVREYHLNRLAEVFGPDLPILPSFTATTGRDLHAALAASANLQGNDPHAAVTWLQRSARVREGAGRLHAATVYAEALGGASLDFSVGQLPYLANDRWVGLPLVGPRPPGGRLSLVAHTPATVDATKPLVGLLIDEWTEVVPSPEETTGLVFHYDQPSAKAPHAILLAVAPDDKPAWDLETLQATIVETLELARLRTVDPAALPDVSPFLPALYVVEDGHDKAVTSNFDGLVGPVA